MKEVKYVHIAGLDDGSGVHVRIGYGTKEAAGIVYADTPASMGAEWRLLMEWLPWHLPDTAALSILISQTAEGLEVFVPLRPMLLLADSGISLERMADVVLGLMERVVVRESDDEDEEEATA